MNKLLMNAILSIFLFSSLPFFALQAFAQAPEVVVTISSDTAWLMSDNPHVLTAPLLINQGATLTIQAGSVVDLNGYELRVNGTLCALGNLNDQIYISSGKISFTEYSNGWNEQSNSGNVLKNTLLEGVTVRSSMSLKVVDSYMSHQLEVGESSIIRNNIIDELSIIGGSVEVTNNTINTITNCYGAPEISFNTIYAIGGNSGGFGGSPMISHNNIRMIGGYEYKDSKILFHYFRASSATITNNNITEGIYLTGGSSVIAENTITGYLYTYTVTGFDTFFRRTETTETFRTLGIFFVGSPYYLQAEVHITGNTISGCSTGIKCGTGDNQFGKSIVIENNLINQSYSSGIETSLNTIIRNNAITHSSPAIKLTRCPSAVINQNNIENNGKKVYLEETSANIDATTNWWGTTDAEEINLDIHDFKYDFDLGKVSITPFLTEPNTEVGPKPTQLIPEFSTWHVLPFVLVVFFGVMICKHKIEKGISKGSHFCAAC